MEGPQAVTVVGSTRGLETGGFIPPKGAEPCLVTDMDDETYPQCHVSVAVADRTFRGTRRA
eukprot:scaffold1_cov375-Pavlova_lutheri.AAC.4